MSLNLNVHPAVIIIQADGKRIEVYEDGHIRGIAGTVINRIPHLIREAVNADRAKAAHKPQMRA